MDNILSIFRKILPPARPPVKVYKQKARIAGGNPRFLNWCKNAGESRHSCLCSLFDDLSARFDLCFLVAIAVTVAIAV